MNADYIKKIEKKAKELSKLINSAALREDATDKDLTEFKFCKKMALDHITEAVARAKSMETIN